MTITPWARYYFAAISNTHFCSLSASALLSPSQVRGLLVYTLRLEDSFVAGVLDMMEVLPMKCTHELLERWKSFFSTVVWTENISVRHECWQLELCAHLSVSQMWCWQQSPYLWVETAVTHLWICFLHQMLTETLLKWFLPVHCLSSWMSSPSRQLSKANQYADGSQI